MRLSGGALKGRKIKSRSLGVTSRYGVLRATASKVRESVFNIIGPAIRGAVFVDLYAGTGAVGMEALSRGAETVYFVEADRKRARAIEDALEGCGCSSRAIVLNMKAAQFAASPPPALRLMEIVFMDPPYDDGEIPETISAIAQSRAFGAGAVLLVEHATKLRLPVTSGGLTAQKTYKYGDTTLTLYAKE